LLRGASDNGSIEGKVERDVLIGMGNPTVRESDRVAEQRGSSRGGGSGLGSVMCQAVTSGGGSAVPGQWSIDIWSVPAAGTMVGGSVPSFSSSVGALVRSPMRVRLPRLPGFKGSSAFWYNG
jgi:hypothetical protein